MGGVTVTPDQLQGLHRGDYILHARDGKLTEIAVEKIRLPLDPAVYNGQQLGFQAAPDGTLYATTHTQVSKSIDGGKTWTHKRCKIGENDFGGLQGFGTVVNKEGRLLFIGEPWFTIWSTDDDGETWYKAGEFDTSFEKQGYDGSCLRLPRRHADDPHPGTRRLRIAGVMRHPRGCGELLALRDPRCDNDVLLPIQRWWKNVSLSLDVRGLVP